MFKSWSPGLERCHNGGWFFFYMGISREKYFKIVFLCSVCDMTMKSSYYKRGSMFSITISRGRTSILLIQNLFHFIVHIFLYYLIPLILLCLLLVRWEMSSMGLLFFVLFIPGSDSLWHHWSLWSFLLLCRGKRNNCILFVFRGGLFVRADKKGWNVNF